MRTLTWNMQGSLGNSYDSKWGIVSRLLNDSDLGIDICCLQECGRTPERFGLQQYALGPNGPYYFQGGHNFRTHYRPNNCDVVYYPWDTGGGRCNLAIVSNIPVRAVNLLYSGGRAQHRPILCADLGNIAVASIHAMSGGGNDAPGLITSFSNSAGNAGLPWMSFGDYNRDPATMVGQVLNSTVVSSGQATHSGGNELDYAICVNGLGLNCAGTLDVSASDHLPVVFDL